MCFPSPTLTLLTCEIEGVSDLGKTCRSTAWTYCVWFICPVRSHATPPIQAWCFVELCIVVILTCCGSHWLFGKVWAPSWLRYNGACKRIVVKWNPHHKGLQETVGWICISWNIWESLEPRTRTDHWENILYFLPHSVFSVHLLPCLGACKNETEIKREKYWIFYFKQNLTSICACIWQEVCRS